MPAQAAAALQQRRPSLRSFSHELADGARTTVHVAAYPARTTRVRVVAMPGPLPLAGWCEENRVDEAIVGGFFLRQGCGTPLGDLWVGGEQLRSVPFDEPWAASRSCVSIQRGRVALAARNDLPEHPRGDLLQVGPLLVSRRRSLIADGVDPEGFSANQSQFDSDITAGRYPRAALGLAPGSILSVACDGRSTSDAGLSMAELAVLLVQLGAVTAINLDGGGSTSLVSGGRLRNTPREEHGIELVAGRPVSTALVFELL